MLAASILAYSSLVAVPRLRMEKNGKTEAAGHIRHLFALAGNRVTGILPDFALAHVSVSVRKQLDGNDGSVIRLRKFDCDPLTLSPI